MRRFPVLRRSIRGSCIAASHCEGSLVVGWEVDFQLAGNALDGLKESRELLHGELGAAFWQSVRAPTDDDHLFRFDDDQSFRLMTTTCSGRSRPPRQACGRL